MSHIGAEFALLSSAQFASHSGARFVLLSSAQFVLLKGVPP